MCQDGQRVLGGTKRACPNWIYTARTDAGIAAPKEQGGARHPIVQESFYRGNVWRGSGLAEGHVVRSRSAD